MSNNKGNVGTRDRKILCLELQRGQVILGNKRIIGYYKKIQRRGFITNRKSNAENSIKNYCISVQRGECQMFIVEPLVIIGSVLIGDTLI